MTKSGHKSCGFEARLRLIALNQVHENESIKVLISKFAGVAVGPTIALFTGVDGMHFVRVHTG